MVRLQTVADSIDRFFSHRCDTSTTRRRQPAGRVWAIESLETRIVPATIITVTSPSDSGAGTLRAAIEQANLDMDQDTIDFAPSVTGTISLLSALSDLSASMTINGPGASTLSIARSDQAGIAAFRIFTVPDGVDAAISGLTVSGGLGDTLSIPQGETINVGGGIENEGTLTLTGCTISDNSASDFGGGINNLGTLNVVNSTISGNSGGSGGGIENGGTMSLTNCTVSGNQGNFGGGIENGIITTFTSSLTVYKLSVTNCTISDNSAGTVGGITGIDNYFGTITNSLISGNVGGSFGGLTAVTLSHDLITDAPDPFLAPLAANGGPTQTMALLPGSPAINAGVPVAGVTTDQRGVSIPQGTAPDIGAFESRGFTIAIVAGDNQIARGGLSFAQPLTVLVTSPFGEPVAGGRVTFAAPTTGAFASLSTTSAIIAANGEAATIATANNGGGSYTVTAGTAGATMNADFTLTNLAPPAVRTVVPVMHSGKAITRIILGFSEDLVPGSATKSRFFSAASGVEKGHKLVFNKRVKISGVSYDGATDQVTIRLARAVKGEVRIIVHGGIMATDGLSSQGAFTAVVN